MNLIPEPYRLLAVLILWAASLATVGIWQRHDGEASVTATWQARETKEQQAAAAQFKSLSDAARAAEQKYTNEMATLASNYERKLSDANKQRISDLAALRAGTLRLRDPGTSHVSTCPSSTAQAGTSPGRSDGSTPSQLQATANGLLSTDASQFLINFAADADDVARQLAACQQVIEQDRAQ